VSDIKIIGFGNALRGDDGVGQAVVEVLEAHAVACEALDGDGTELMEAWRGYETVFVVDTTLSGAPPGTVVRIDARQTTLGQGLWRSSSHQFGVAEAVELCRALDELPPKLILYGVEGACFDYGAGLTEDVARSIDDVAARIAGEVGS